MHGTAVYFHHRVQIILQAIKLNQHPSPGLMSHFLCLQNMSDIDCNKVKIVRKSTECTSEPSIIVLNVRLVTF